MLHRGGAGAGRARRVDAAGCGGGAGASSGAPGGVAPPVFGSPEPAAPGPVPLGEGRFDPAAGGAAGAVGRPAHLRLTREAWEVIRGERLAGASIAELARKWDVSDGAIRRHARDEGWTNTHRGEAVSRAMVEAKIAERAFAEGRAAAEREAAERAAAASPGHGDGGPDEDEVEAEADPLEAARTLLRRAAAAAVAGRLAQAGAAVKLAEGLARAASALGLDDDDDWESEPEEPRLSPEALEALRDDVCRRYARFDRPEREDGDAGGKGGFAATPAAPASAPEVAPPPAPAARGPAGRALGPAVPAATPGRPPPPRHLGALPPDQRSPRAAVGGAERELRSFAALGVTVC